MPHTRSERYLTTPPREGRPARTLRPDDLKQRMQEENEREETIRQQLQVETLFEKQQPKLSPNEVIEVAKSLKENWSFLEPDHKKMIMQTLFSP
jgi:hypothetical protein